MNDPEEVDRYLTPRLGQMPDPFLLSGMEAASRRVARAIREGHRVTLYGDYDVDGVTSTALLQDFLLHHGLRARSYIPHRLEEGYGLNHEAVERLAAEGTDLLVTLDCGITAVDEVAAANARGMDVVVVDHHRCPPELPQAVATLNPHQPGCRYPDKVLAAVGVAFNLAAGVRKTLREEGAYGEDGPAEPNLRRALDLVALGTIADMVPLTGVNRLFAWFGLEEMRKAERPGLRALMEVSGVRPRRLGSQDVSFKLAPRINAAGRLEDASVGVHLLTASRMDEARRSAARLDAANADRRVIQAEVLAEARQQADQRGDAAALVLHHPDWHPGVVGIVASQLVEAYQRPVAVVGQDGRGSARTFGGLHLYDALSACGAHLLKFGGHRAAAGFRIAAASLEGFRAAFEVEVGRRGSEIATPPDAMPVDLEVRADEISLELARLLSRLEPFGIGNPQPVCRVEALPVQRAAVVGGQHLKLRVGAGPRPLSAIAFRQADREPELSPGTPVELAGHLEVNDYAGFERVELRVRDLGVPDRR
jgi:single-stranded-DNA-specific exonuclease